MYKFTAMQSVTSPRIPALEALRVEAGLEGWPHAGVAHELNTALQIVSGCVGFCLNAAARDARRREDLQNALKATEWAASLVTKLRPTCSAAEPAKPLQPERSIGTLLAFLRPLVSDSIRLEASVDSHLPEVLVDEVGLLQTLMNLCLNARDAMPAGGLLSVQADALVAGEARCAIGRPPRGECVRFTVKDEGLGMNGETLARLFVPGYTTKESPQGRGLGLALVAQWVLGQGGAIRVNSREGAGASFEVLLPASEDADR